MKRKTLQDVIRFDRRYGVDGDGVPPGTVLMLDQEGPRFIVRITGHARRKAVAHSVTIDENGVLEREPEPPTTMYAQDIVVLICDEKPELVGLTGGVIPLTQLNEWRILDAA